MPRSLPAADTLPQLPRDLVRTLQGWYTEHMDHPYPSEEQKVLQERLWGRPANNS